MNGRAGKCCTKHVYEACSTDKCCKRCPMHSHQKIGVWQSLQGKRYCGAFSLHQAWVEWPCEAVA